MNGGPQTRITPQALDAPFPIYAAEISSLLPSGWQAEIQAVVSLHGFHSKLDGGSVTSRDGVFQAQESSQITVVDGRAAAAGVPWLLDVYRGPILDMANALGLGRYRPSQAIHSAVNINCQRDGERYEWHVDSNPLTGLLFASTLDAGQGGQLVFREDPLASGSSEDWELRIRPRLGVLHLYDARAVAHTVEPVLGDRMRLSIPMNFYFANDSEHRPGDLDDYLYRTS